MSAVLFHRYVNLIAKASTATRLSTSRSALHQKSSQRQPGKAAIDQSYAWGAGLPLMAASYWLFGVIDHAGGPPHEGEEDSNIFIKHSEALLGERETLASSCHGFCYLRLGVF